MKDEDERLNILISHINLQDDESVHCNRPYNSKLPQFIVIMHSRILDKQSFKISLGTYNLPDPKCNAYVKFLRENKEYCLFLYFWKKAYYEKPFNLKCLCYETF